jgi:hypothetical protein
MTSPREKKFESAQSAGKIMATVFLDDRDVIRVSILPRGTSLNCDSSGETQRGWMLSFAFTKFFLQEICHMCCWSMPMPVHAHVGIVLRPSQNLDEQCCHINHTVLTSHHQIFSCLLVWKVASEDTIMQLRRPCRMLCAICSRGKESDCHWVGVLALVQSGRRMLRMLETVEK